MEGFLRLAVRAFVLSANSIGPDLFQRRVLSKLLDRSVKPRAAS
jgi:hypothetical protein